MSDSSEAWPPRAATTDDSQKKMLKYARQTRNATVFIAWIVGIGVTAALIMGIIFGIQTARVANELNSPGGTGTSSNCLSQGGTDPNC